MKNISNKTAFITGGASGIGLGIAQALLAANANVVIADIREDHLQQARETLGNEDKVLALQLDVTDRAAFELAADKAEEKFGNLHILVNNAGVAVVGPIELANYNDWDWIMGVNLFGTINGITAILPRIRSHNEGGHIVSTASMSGLLPHPGAVIYGTTKAAVVGMSESMRAELEPHNITVSVFCPGPVQSNIAEAGKTRPDNLSETGYAEADKQRQKGGDFFHLYKTAEEIGERVCEGILNDELYILTHSEFRQGLEDRAAAINAAIPDLPENPELKSTFGILFRNPVHAEETERQLKRKQK